MGGAWLSGRLAGRITPRRRIRHGLSVMLSVALANVALNGLFEPHPAWALLPIAVFSFGWSLMVPVVTLLALDQVPDCRGIASSVQASLANAAVAGLLVPLVMHSTLALVSASLALTGIGLASWTWVKPRLQAAPG